MGRVGMACACALCACAGNADMTIVMRTHECCYHIWICVYGSIDFKINIALVCVREMKVLCPGVRKGQAQMLKCLQDNMFHVRMGDGCRKEVEADYRASLGYVT